MPGKVARLELTDLTGFSDVSVINEMKEDYFRNIANTTVKPVLSRLRSVYARYRGRIGWNVIVAIGLQLYSLHKKGYDINVTIARELARKFGRIPDNILREIVNAVQAEQPAGRARR